MKWGDSSRDFDTVLAVWPTYRPLYDRWLLEELIEQDQLPPKWRDRRVPTSSGHVKLDVYESGEAATVVARELNEDLERALSFRNIASEEKRSLQLKVWKRLQARERLDNEEKLMLAEALRRHQADSRPAISDLILDPKSEPYREELHQQLLEMPYLRIALVGEHSRRILVNESGSTWSRPIFPNATWALRAVRARIANGFGKSSVDHWGKTKASIRQELLPRANQLLQLAGVQRMLAEAFAAGKRVLVSNGFVFWYEAHGNIGWQVKQAVSGNSADGETLWREGTIHSVNHGRLVVLPYIKEDGTHVRGHTKNAPSDGPALPRHPDHYVDIPFEVLSDDLMIGLFGELPYE